MDSTLHSSAKGVVIVDDHILLVRYDEGGWGVHYNLPGGRQRKDETLHDTVRRKMMEEAGADVAVGPLLFVYEFIGKNHQFDDGPKHSVSMVFACSLRPGSRPGIEVCTKPEGPSTGHPTLRQTGVCWLPLDEFRKVVFWPSVPDRIIDLHRRSTKADDRYLGDIL